VSKLEDLRPNAAVKGIIPDALVTVVQVQWFGSEALELAYKDHAGRLGSQLLYRHDEPRIEVVEQGRPWSFDGDGTHFRLVSEANRIRLAYLFDPVLAVHTSMVEPLPHQITAVYESMLTRQPLRFLLADDPGAGKTIMTGLLMKELIARGDLQRCLIVCPGILAEQWQDELHRRFHLPFEILTNDGLEAARSGNWFMETNLAIARLDKLSRNEDVQKKLAAPDCRWDLVVCDEAHKLSATFFGGEVRYTKRYRLGQLLSTLTRHFLLLTATPHNGKEEDFQLFMSLLDGDRFEGKFRDGVHSVDVSDLMRRMVKENLLKFDSTHLFPERMAYTVPFKLSGAEARLYREVTEYVREEFDRAEALQNDKQAGTVGFALTILQRRLASSPLAISESLRRRRERLEKRLRELELLQRGADGTPMTGPLLDSEDINDLDDAPDAEGEAEQEDVLDRATAARTIQELKLEIDRLRQLEGMARAIRRADDNKWSELSALLNDIFTPAALAIAEERAPYGSGEIRPPVPSPRQKLVVFTEHRDTLTYLTEGISSLLGRSEAVVTVHGGLGREERQKAQEAFLHDPQVQVLVATDAAGEGINLQRAHLMVNYDLPWNPNRIEQRFGRIHRIGQTEVCHLWNLVAAETREGDVYLTLLKKLEEERKALGGAVFDVLGRALQGKELRQLMVEAVRYGDQPEVRARLQQVVDDRLDREHLKALIEERALAHEQMDARRVREIREDMERAEARRLQPHFIASFFLTAFKLLGGRISERESKRYEITYVPARIRNRDRQIGVGDPVLERYERITFDKELISVPGKPLAAFLCPGHPLLDATSDLILEQYRDLLKRGAVLADPNDPSEQPRALLYLEHSIQDARLDQAGSRRVVSRRMQFVEMDETGEVRSAGYAPYLDYRPLESGEAELVQRLLDEPWLKEGLEGRAQTYAIAELVPRHLAELKSRKEELVAKTLAAVKERLTKEIFYWDHRAEQLRLQEQAGKVNARLNSGLARLRADDLQARLRRRLEELEQERRLSPLPPVVLGGALVVPAGLLARLRGERQAEPDQFARETRRVELLAMQAVMETERRLGFEPRDVSRDNAGYDIESRPERDSPLRFLEVKGRIRGATAVTLTKNEILTALNKPDDWILALVEVPPSPEFSEGDAFRVSDEGPAYGVSEGCMVRYVRRPFQREPDFGVTSVNYNLRDLLARAEDPS
jgi:superfamily II DNA or RNA helicase